MANTYYDHGWGCSSRVSCGSPGSDTHCFRIARFDYSYIEPSVEKIIVDDFVLSPSLVAYMVQRQYLRHVSPVESTNSQEHYLHPNHNHAPDLSRKLRSGINFNTWFEVECVGTKVFRFSPA
jgi:hypothetical protein